MSQRVVRYSEAFKMQVVEELEQGRFGSTFEATRAYGIGGGDTVPRYDWAMDAWERRALARPGFELGVRALSARRCRGGPSPKLPWCAVVCGEGGSRANSA